MSLMKKCCIILMVMFTFEVSIAVGMGVLVAETEKEEARIGFSHSLIGLVEQLNSTMIQFVNAFVNSFFFGAAFDLSFEKQFFSDCDKLEELLKSKLATEEDKKAIRFVLKSSKYLRSEVRSMVTSLQTGRTTLDYYILVKRFQVELGPAMMLMNVKNKQLLTSQLELKRRRFNNQQVKKAQITTLLMVSSSVNVLIVFGLMIGFANHVTSRLAIVQDNFIRFREQKPLNPAIAGGDEIEVLDGEFHSFARTLREATQKDQAVFNHLPVGLIACSSAGIIERVNPCFEEMTGCSPDQLLGKSVSTLIARGSFDDLLSADAGVISFRRGEEREFLGETVLARYDDQGLPKTLMAVLDVTERAEMEQFKQQLLSMVSHDLRTPLTSLSVSAHCIEEMIRAGELDTSLKLATRIQAEAGRLTRLTSDLLEMARIESKRVSCHFELVPLTVILETVMNGISSAADEKEIAINVQNVSGGIMIQTDADRVVQILINFVSNAIKYSPEGTNISIVSDIADERLKISVVDQGRGIPSEQLHSIFEPFQQVQKDDRRKGTGLGLTICKMLAESLGGSVGVSSVPGTGSTFWLAIPYSTKESTGT